MVYTEKQLSLMRLWQRDGLKRINLLEGSVSSGKTWISLVLWAFWVATMPLDKLYLMCAKSLTTLKRNCLLPLQELVGERNFTFSVPGKEGYLFGRRMLLEGANDARAEGKIRGITLQGAYCDELTLFPEDFFTMLLSRLRLPGAKLISTTNPDAPGHWLKKNYIDRSEDLDFLNVQFVLEDNTTLPEDYVAAIKKEYVGVFYDRFILGRWVLAEGIIYPNYEKALAEPPDGATAEDYRLSIDYGTMNAFAALLWAKYGPVWYAVREFYYSGRDKGIPKTDEDYAGDVDALVRDVMEEREEQVKSGKAVYLKKLKTIIDPSAASFIATLRKRKKADTASQNWYTVIPADNAVVDGIRDTATAMELGLVKVSSTLKSMIAEFEGYVWDDKASEDRPVKENDHAMDSMRYFVYTERLVPRSRKKAA